MEFQDVSKKNNKYVTKCMYLMGIDKIYDLHVHIMYVYESQFNTILQQ